jgi:hypothetical protein
MAPSQPEVADDRKPGQALPKANTGKKPAPGTAPTYVSESFSDSPQAQSLKQASQTGAPFCAVCAAVAAAGG